MPKTREKLGERVKALLVGRARNIRDPSLFSSMSLVAFFAWVGLGADGLSSSCYGPQEAFLTLREHPYLAIFVALAPSLISQLFFMRAVEMIGPGRAGIFTNLTPLFGALFAILLLGEPFRLYHGVAMALGLAGIALAESARTRRIASA